MLGGDIFALVKWCAGVDKGKFSIVNNKHIRNIDLESYANGVIAWCVGKRPKGGFPFTWLWFRQLETGALEGQNFRETRKLVSLSEQQLVDCSGSFGNNGCNGGWMDNAFEYVMSNGGLDTEASYPYEAMDMKCRFNPDTTGATCWGLKDIYSGSENALQEAVATIGPISVAIDASQRSFQLYESGVYDEPGCGRSGLNHGVLAVGYGTDYGKDYWLVKNSWGLGWGDNGYIKMSRNRNNQCRIASAASYPLV